MKRHILVILLLILNLLVVKLIGQDDVGLLESANAAYENNAYDEAIQGYTKLLGFDYYSTAVYNNLGSAYFKKGEIPLSILYFEKGLKINPFDKSILHNLSIAREQLDSDVVAIPEFILKRGWKFLFTRFSANTWYTLGMLLSLLSVAAFGVWLLKANRSDKKKGFFGGVICLLLSILCFCFSSSQAKFQYQLKTAIVLQSGVDLKSAPEEANKPIMTIQPGTKLRIIDKIGAYEKVLLTNGQSGWIPQGSYQLI